MDYSEQQRLHCNFRSALLQQVSKPKIKSTKPEKKKEQKTKIQLEISVCELNTEQGFTLGVCESRILMYCMCVLD